VTQMPVLAHAAGQGVLCPLPLDLVDDALQVVLQFGLLVLDVGQDAVAQLGIVQQLWLYLLEVGVDPYVLVSVLLVPDQVRGVTRQLGVHLLQLGSALGNVLLCAHAADLVELCYVRTGVPYRAFTCTELIGPGWFNAGWFNAGWFNAGWFDAGWFDGLP